MYMPPISSDQPTNLRCSLPPYSISITEPSIRSVLLPSSVRSKKPSPPPPLPSGGAFSTRNARTSPPGLERRRSTRALPPPHSSSVYETVGGDSRNQRRCSETRSPRSSSLLSAFPSPSLYLFSHFHHNNISCIPPLFLLGDPASQISLMFFTPPSDCRRAKAEGAAGSTSGTLASLCSRVRSLFRHVRVRLMWEEGTPTDESPSYAISLRMGSLLERVSPHLLS